MRQGVFQDPALGQMMARGQVGGQPGMRAPGMPYPDHASRAVELETLAEARASGPVCT